MKYLLVLLASVIILAGCNRNIKQPESKIFLREDLDLSHISRIAVLPFVNVTGGELNAQRMRDIFITKLRASDKFEVVDKDLVDSTLREMTVDFGDSLDKSVLKILAKKLEVNGFMTLTMNRIEGRGWGPPPYPEISLTLHLIDAETALVLWHSTAYRNAYSDSRGLKLDTKNKLEITLKLVQNMIESIPK